MNKFGIVILLVILTMLTACSQSSDPRFWLCHYTDENGMKQTVKLDDAWSKDKMLGALMEAMQFRPGSLSPDGSVPNFMIEFTESLDATDVVQADLPLEISLKATASSGVFLFRAQTIDGVTVYQAGYGEGPWEAKYESHHLEELKKEVLVDAIDMIRNAQAIE